MRRYLGLVWTIARKDLLVEMRTRERISAMAAFAILVPVLFNFAIDTAQVRPQAIAAGLIWMTIVFSGILGLGRTFQMEQKDGALSGILQSPIPLDALYLGKVTANFVLLSVIVTLVFIVFGLFFGLRFVGNSVTLAGVVALGVFGLVALTTLLSAIASRSTMGESLLPVLVFPLVVPVIIYGATATDRLLAGRPLAEVTGNLRMLAAFALVFVVAGAVLFPFVIEE